MADKQYFYFVSKFAQKNNSMFIVHVLLKSKHYVILLFKMAKKAFEAAQPEKTKRLFFWPNVRKKSMNLHAHQLWFDPY